MRQDVALLISVVRHIGPKRRDGGVRRVVENLESLHSMLCVCT